MKPKPISSIRVDANDKKKHIHFRSKQLIRILCECFIIYDKLIVSYSILMLAIFFDSLQIQKAWLHSHYLKCLRDEPYTTKSTNITQFRIQTITWWNHENQHLSSFVVVVANYAKYVENVCMKINVKFYLPSTILFRSSGIGSINISNELDVKLKIYVNLIKRQKHLTFTNSLTPNKCFHKRQYLCSLNKTLLKWQSTEKFWKKKKLKHLF